MTAHIIDRPLVPLEVATAAKLLLGRSLNDLEGLVNHVSDLDRRTFPRASLASSLADYNVLIGNDSHGCANAESLAETDTLMVVTGQQAGLFTGPAYTIHKAVTAVKLAASLADRLGRKVIPVYWNATEDHDLSEVATCHFPETSWTAEFPDGGFAAESFGTGPVVACLQAFLESLPEYVRSDIADLLDVRHETYGEYTSSVIARLFAGTGLVVLEPKLLRPLAGDFFRTALVENDRLREALDTFGSQMHTQGVEPGFSVDDSSGVFILDDDGCRRRLTRIENGFDLGGRTLTVSEAVAMAGQASTAAWLRPVLQNRLLPVAAFVAGPGEVRYHLQLKGVFDAFDVPMAPMWTRNHATVLGGRDSKSWHALGWTDDDLYRSVDELRPLATLPAGVEHTFEEGLMTIRGLGETLSHELNGYNCEATVAGFLTRTEKEFGKIKNRVVKEQRTREGVDNRRIDALRRVVRPGDGPQERYLNVFALMSSYGPDLMRDLLECFDPFETGHYLIFKD